MSEGSVISVVAGGEEASWGVGSVLWADINRTPWAGVLNLNRDEAYVSTTVCKQLCAVAAKASLRGAERALCKTA